MILLIPVDQSTSCCDAVFRVVNRAYLSGMILCGFSALLLLGCLPIHAAFADPGVAPLRIAFWNIQWFPGKRPDATHWEEKDHAPLVQKVVKEISPDILGMGEIRNEDAAKVAIATLEGMNIDICSRFLLNDGTIGTQQVALTSRLKPVSAWSESWQQRSGITIPRGFSFAAYPMGSDSIVLVYGVHFKSNRGEMQQNVPAREASSRQLLAHAEKMEEIYAKAYKNVAVVLAGDFNTSLDDPRFGSERTLRDLQKAGFTWAWEKIPVAERTTLPSQPQMDPKFSPYPPASFDHIFVKGAEIVRCEAFPSSPLASDHRPVVADLLIPITPVTSSSEVAE